MGDLDPYGLDLQLALYVCYELHYRGFAGVGAHADVHRYACGWRVLRLEPHRTHRHPRRRTWCERGVFAHNLVKISTLTA